MRQTAIKRDTSDGHGNGRGKKIKAPPAIDQIRDGANRLRGKSLQLERAAAMSADKAERLASVAEIAAIAQRLGPEIEAARAELGRIGDDRECRHSLLRQMLVAKYGEYKAKAELAKAVADDRTLDAPKALLDGLESGKDACSFALERLVSSPDAEVRNVAFDALKDNPVALKLACMDSPYPDIKKRARELLSNPNAHFTNYVPKGEYDYLARPVYQQYRKKA